MKQARPLLRILHGSHLYGTSTPASDLDYKGVFLPSGEDILLQKVPSVIDKGTGSQDQKNTKDDVDDQSFNLQKFLKLIVSGDTVGTELLFAPPEFVEVDSPEMETIRANKHLLLNRQCKGFVGYCQRQAAKYGIKGSRMAAVRDILTVLHNVREAFGGKTKLADRHETWEKFCEDHEFSEIIEIRGGGNKDVRHLSVCDRKIPYTSTVDNAFEVYAKVYENYGDRARAAMHNEGIDWKAISHAVRVARQTIELLETGHITFPRPDAAELLDIKLGKRDFESDVAPLLEGLVQQVEETAARSQLPEESDSAAIEKLIKRMHYDQVVV